MARTASLQIQESTQDTSHGSQFMGCDGAKTAVKALIRDRPGVFGPGEGRELAQARRWRRDRDLMPKAPVPTGDRYHEDDPVRQR